MAAQRVAIVTGANSGIGFRATQIMCRQGIEVIVACRSEARGNEAIAKLKEGQRDAKLQFMQLDLANLKSVQTFAAAFIALDKPLHILVNNAGLYDTDGPRRETSDGLEMHFGTNHVGHFLLTSLLLDNLKKAGTPENKSRIVVIASKLHDGECKDHPKKLPEIDFDDLNLSEAGVYSGKLAYKNSKAATVMFTVKLAKMIEKDNVTVNCMCPGFIPSTGLNRDANCLAQCMMSCVLGCLLKPCLKKTRTVDHGAGLIVELSTDAKHEGETGQYYSDYKASQTSAESQDEEKQNKMWTMTQSIIAEKLPGVKVM